VLPAEKAVELQTRGALKRRLGNQQESSVAFRRLGSVTGQDKTGRICVVSVYRDGGGFKLCGPTGSRIVEGPLAALPLVAANAFELDDPTFVPSDRAA
jgi:hypothetical protein